MATSQINLRKDLNSEESNYKDHSGYPTELLDLSEQNPKYLTLSSTDVGKPISSYSCFAVDRAIKLISPEILSISSLRNGSLLILVKNLEIADKFVEAKELIGIGAITCELQEAMNCVKGIIYAPYLVTIPDSEILEELRAQHVKAVHKFRRTINGISRPTGKILLTFDRHGLPPNIDIAWKSERVVPYIPYPMRCRNCQLLGHTTKRCMKEAACSGCNLTPHAPRECIRTQCANCQEEHPASSPICSHYQRLKEIIRIRFRNNCSMRQARIIFHSRQLAIVKSRVSPTNNRSAGNKIQDLFFDVPESRSSSSVPYPSTSLSSFDPYLHPCTGNDRKRSSKDDSSSSLSGTLM